MDVWMTLAPYTGARAAAEGTKTDCVAQRHDAVRFWPVRSRAFSLPTAFCIFFRFLIVSCGYGGTIVTNLQDPMQHTERYTFYTYQNVAKSSQRRDKQLQPPSIYLLRPRALGMSGTDAVKLRRLDFEIDTQRSGRPGST